MNRTLLTVLISALTFMAHAPAYAQATEDDAPVHSAVDESARRQADRLARQAMRDLRSIPGGPSDAGVLGAQHDVEVAANDVSSAKRGVRELRVELAVLNPRSPQTADPEPATRAPGWSTTRGLHVALQKAEADHERALQRLHAAQIELVARVELAREDALIAGTQGR